MRNCTRDEDPALAFDADQEPGNRRLYRIYSIARQDGIDFNLASIPADFSQSSDQPFDQKYMIALYDHGYAVGCQNQPWAKASPELDAATGQQSKLFH